MDSGIRVPSSLPPVKLISMASRYGIFPVEAASTIREVRAIRNNAVHGLHPISKSQAEWLVTTTKDILGSIRTLDKVNTKNKN